MNHTKEFLDTSVEEENRLTHMDVKAPDLGMASPVLVEDAKDPKVTDLSEDPEYHGSFMASVIRCRNLGWRLAAVDAREMVDLAVNFEEPVEDWLRQCRQTGSLQGRVNLGVHTGSASGLVVLEVGNGEGKSALDHCGSWRSHCQARMNGREQHFYALPSGVFAPLTRFLMAAQVMLYGEGGMAPLPPSVDVQTQEFWRWVNPPWEYPPPELPQSLQEVLKQLSSQAPVAETQDEILSWEEVYSLITPHATLLKALLAPHRSLEEHYVDLLEKALNAGFRDQSFLLGLLWHAPQGDVEKNPGRGSQLKQMVREAKPGPYAPPESRLLSVTAGPDSGNGGHLNRSHREQILDELKRLRQKAAELEAAVLDWEQTKDMGRTPAPPGPEVSLQVPGHHSAQNPEILKRQHLFSVINESLVKGARRLMPASRPGSSNDDLEVWRNHYAELSPKAQKDLPPEAVEATIRACLQKSPDLAQDPTKLQMVQYCLKNYVNIDPDLSDLSLPERWERASQMAREFLGGHTQA